MTWWGNHAPGALGKSQSHHLHLHPSHHHFHLFLFPRSSGTAPAGPSRHVLGSFGRWVRNLQCPDFLDSLSWTPSRIFALWFTGIRSFYRLSGLITINRTHRTADKIQTFDFPENLRLIFRNKEDVNKNCKNHVDMKMHRLFTLPYSASIWERAPVGLRHHANWTRPSTDLNAYNGSHLFTQKCWFS